MSQRQNTKYQKRVRRQARIRARLSGTAARPRLHVFRSISGIYVQLIDDTIGKTLVSVNSKIDGKGKPAEGDRSGKVALAYALGQALSEKAKAAKIITVVFDRAGRKYHGRIKAVAEGARDGGLIF